MSAPFVHLHLHSEYSLIDGLVRVKSLPKYVADAGMPAVAITDHCNLFALVKFYKAALAQGIKPLIGSDILLAPEGGKKAPTRLVLLCQNQAGYHNLTQLISKAYLDGQETGQPLVSRTWLAEHAEGLIVLSGGLYGELGQALHAGDQARALGLLEDYQKLFPNRFYIELMRTGRLHEEDYVHAAVAFAGQHQVPVVATNDVRFLHAEDFEAHEARVCIHEGWILTDSKRPRRYVDQQYLRTPAEMAELFADIPEAIANTVEIAKRCNVQLTLGKHFLPNFPVPQGMTVESYLDQQAEAGLEQRLKRLYPVEKITQQRPIYNKRLGMELEIIKSMGFPGYFLIVADFIQWAKNNGIPVGPGRGSGAGSLVAYSLGITDLDPITYDLLFERFLNPERVSMPDFDVDFCMEGRDRVIEYVSHKYGRESVSQIITYGSMAARAVVRDVGRVLGNGYGFVDKIAKLIPFELGMTLNKALADEEALLDRYEREEEVSTLIDLALKLEGVPRNAGKHAGGVVIAASKLTDFTPLYCEQGGDNLVTQLDKDDVEAVGLVKFDFLGLRTLTIIDWAVQSINARLQQHQEDPIDIMAIDLDDPATFDLLKNCKTTAVFQLESRGMKDLIKRLQPDCFEEIVALVALFRPGPLQSGMVDDFINRKHGRARVEYMHPDLEAILKPTYGVILYQEQVMQIAQVLGGYSLGAADLLRRAMGKKKPEEMAKQRSIFLQGATTQGVEAKTAENIFNLMEKFAGYGFNKSHSAAYALLAYQTGWLKAHYPAEFMAAVLSSDMDHTDKVVRFINDCDQMNIEIKPPSVNHSHYQFTVDDEHHIVYGLGAIKGVGEAAVNDLVSEREQHGNYQNLFEFCRRIDTRKSNRKTLEAFIRSGALDCFGVNRATLMQSMNAALKASEQQERNQQCGQVDMFASVTEAEPTLEVSYHSSEPWPDQQRLQGEKETLGLYLTGHPIEQYEAELKHLVSTTIGRLHPKRNQVVKVAGFVSGIRTIIGRKGRRMAFLTLEDRTGRIDMAVFSDVYEDSRDVLQKDNLLIVEGEVSVDDYTGGYKISAKRLLDMAQARQLYARALTLTLTPENAGPEQLEKLKNIIESHKGGSCPIKVCYQSAQGSVELQFSKQWRVMPSDELLQSLDLLCGQPAAEFCYE